RLMLDRPITLDQPVYLPGNEQQGVWASSLLETVFGPGPGWERGTALSPDTRLSLRGDLELAVFAAGELRRPYTDLQVSHDTRDEQVVPREDRRPEIPPIAIDDHLHQQVR